MIPSLSASRHSARHSAVSLLSCCLVPARYTGQRIYSNAHWFSRLTSSSSSGVKSFLMLNVLRISSGVLPARLQEEH